MHFSLAFETGILLTIENVLSSGPCRTFTEILWIARNFLALSPVCKIPFAKHSETSCSESLAAFASSLNENFSRTFIQLEGRNLFRYCFGAPLPRGLNRRLSCQTYSTIHTASSIALAGDEANVKRTNIPPSLTLSLSLLPSSVIKFNNSTITRNSSRGPLWTESSLRRHRKFRSWLSIICACHNISLKSFANKTLKEPAPSCKVWSRRSRGKNFFRALFHGYHPFFIIFRRLLFLWHTFFGQWIVWHYYFRVKTFASQSDLHLYYAFNEYLKIYMHVSLIISFLEVLIIIKIIQQAFFYLSPFIFNIRKPLIKLLQKKLIWSWKDQLELNYIHYKFSWNQKFACIRRIRIG